MNILRAVAAILLTAMLVAPLSHAGQGKDLTPPSPKKSEPKTDPKWLKPVPVKTFKPTWKDFNAAVRSNNAPVIIFFVEKGTEDAFKRPLPDMGGAKGFTYIMLSLSAAELQKANTLAESWKEGHDLFTRWGKPDKSNVEIAALYDVDTLPLAIICDRHFNKLAEAEALETLGDLPNLKEDIEAASKQLEEIFAKETERIEKKYNAEQEKEKFTSDTIRRLLHHADYRQFGRTARAMLQEINDRGETELKEAVAQHEKGKIGEIAFRYRGLPVALKAREAAEEMKHEGE
ncbi:MAG: hypothetical protein A2Z34_06305 [Planctomycetes bacterium RBG_16_59_8]|nr:MAG: hypothetical protein A2Z34_06305 [Planctomycetes bacterium RBG_16_59_8]